MNIKKLFPPISIMDIKALCAFFLLQIYFVSNLLSFGFWRSHIVIFEYLLLFYGVWLILLTLLLLLLLITANFLRLGRFKQIILVVLSLPFFFEVWLGSLEIINSHLLTVASILLIFCLFIYYRFSDLYIGRMAVMISALSAFSFMNHSDIVFIKKDASYSAETVMLDNKRNIHVILLDSFVHSAFSEAFLGVRNPAADYLSSLEDTVDAGYMGFSEYSNTLDTWADIFKLSKYSDSNKIRELKFQYMAFSGSLPSLLTNILRENDYYMQTGFNGSYFGPKGQYIDEYHNHINAIEDTIICRTKDNYLLGFCSKYSKYFYEAWITVNKNQETINWSKKIIQFIGQKEIKKKPIFSAFYIYNPIGHTKSDYKTGDQENFKEYKKRFILGTQKAKELIKDIDQLRQKYPKSIFIVGGDHGALLSRTIRKEDDPRFFVLDRHGVALTLLNASNLCPYSREWLEKQIYLTPSRMLAASLACNGESRKLLEHFEDNEEFIRFGKSLADSN